MKLTLHDDKRQIDLDVKSIKLSPGEVLWVQVERGKLPPSKMQKHLTRIKQHMKRAFPGVEIVVTDDTIDMTKIETK